jgi:membrane-anchored protein YejM (alkaline phosphatase superfamily)
MGKNMAISRKTLLRWCGWFFLGNVLLFCLLGLRYLPAAFPPIAPLEFAVLNVYGKILRTLFVSLSYLGHFALMALIPTSVLAAIIFIMPRKRFIFFIAILLATSMASLLVFDTVAFNLYRFHLNGIILTLLFNGLNEQILGLSSREYAVCGIVILTLFALEFFLAQIVWRLIQKQKFIGWGKWIAGSLGACLYFSYALVFFSSQQEYINKVFIDSVRFLPFYYDVLGSFVARDGSTAIQRMNEGYLLEPAQAESQLNYPAPDFKLTDSKRPFNLLIIAIDAWRFDMVNKNFTPAILQLSEHAYNFEQHFSGGDATGPGIFSLFYSIPSTYWTAMENQHRSPVLIDELIKNHYQMGIFTSATVRLPRFHRTVFQAIQNLQFDMPGDTAYEKDIAVTQAFKQFLNTAQKSHQPFFSFLFYDGAHTYCDYKEDLKPLQPVIMNCERAKLTAYDDGTSYFNRYKNALMLVDNQVKQVIEMLQQHHLLENTIVILTADHGEEFNDNHLGYWGHSSNFTRYQIQIPLIVYWPGEKSQTFSHPTSHYDIVPTLMLKLFNNHSPINTYSIGKNLFDTNHISPYLLSASYISFGIIEPNRITSIYQQGNFEIQDLHAEPLSEAKLNVATMQKVFQDMQRFYAKKST